MSEELNEKVVAKINNALEEMDGDNWKSLNDDGKPPVGVPLIVTIWDSIRNRRELRYPVYYQKSMFGGGFRWCLFGDEERVLMPDYSRVLAWRELPKVWEGYFTEV